MHSDWVASLSEEQLSGHPEWVLEKYFLDRSSKPDRKKTTAPVGIPYDPYSSYRTSQLREAAAKVSGLHCATGHGSKTQTIFLGWNKKNVDKAAKEHVRKETQAAKAEEEERKAERATMHKEHLASIKKQNSKSGKQQPAPVGEYIVDCDEIEGQWPDQVGDGLSLNIFATDNPDFYQADFDFGIIEGIMLLGSNKRALEQYVALKESKGFREDYDSEGEELKDDDNDDDDEEQNAATGSKRKGGNPTAGTKRPHGRPAKKVKTAGKPAKYFVRLKSMETEEGVISPDAESGSIKFNGSDFSSFTGKVDLSFVGTGVPFTARKVSGTTSSRRKSWSEYSSAAYERARVGRWH